MRTKSEPYRVKFTVLIDSAETMPFTFTGITGDAKHDYRKLIVPTRFCSLGRYPNSKGDYSIEGYSDQIGVERKSLEDVQATVLGWDTEYERKEELAGRREKFECELANLAKLESPLVVVEATFNECLRQMKQWGEKSPEENAKNFHRSILAFCQDYKVPWLFFDSRRHAEVATFRFLYRFWDKRRPKRSRKKKPPINVSDV